MLRGVCIGLPGNADWSGGRFEGTTSWSNLHLRLPASSWPAACSCRLGRTLLFRMGPLSIGALPRTERSSSARRRAPPALTAGRSASTTARPVGRRPRRQSVGLSGTTPGGRAAPTPTVAETSGTKNASRSGSNSRTSTGSSAVGTSRARATGCATGGGRMRSISEGIVGEGQRAAARTAKAPRETTCFDQPDAQ
jgi:hypothetical protein